MTEQIGDKCLWWGTTFDEKGNLQPCGAETVGKGLFCDPTHKFCLAVDVCERHKKPLDLLTEQ